MLVTIIVYSNDVPDSFNNITKWLNNIRQLFNEKYSDREDNEFIYYIIRNKSDLEDEK